MPEGCNVIGGPAPLLLMSDGLKVRRMSGEARVHGQSAGISLYLSQHHIVIRKQFARSKALVVGTGIEAVLGEFVTVGVDDLDDEVGVLQSQRSEFVEQRLVWLRDFLSSVPLRVLLQVGGIVVTANVVAVVHVAAAIVVKDAVEQYKESALPILIGAFSTLIEPLQGTILGVQIHPNPISKWIGSVLLRVAVGPLVFEEPIASGNFQGSNGKRVHVHVLVKVATIEACRLVVERRARNLCAMQSGGVTGDGISPRKVLAGIEVELRHERLSGLRRFGEFGRCIGAAVSVAIANFIVTRCVQGEPSVLLGLIAQKQQRFGQEGGIARHFGGFGISNVDHDVARSRHHFFHQGLVLGVPCGIGGGIIDVRGAPDDAQRVGGGAGRCSRGGRARAACRGLLLSSLTVVTGPDELAGHCRLVVDAME